MAEAPWQRVFALADLQEGRMRAARVGDREVLVCRTRAGLYAVDIACSHAAARLDEGRLRGVHLTCALHGASFDVRTGAVVGAPATAPLATHAVRIADGQVEVALGT